ncbi:MAG: hypothetical protein QXW58_05375 [Thermosphaera sp.]
MKSLRPTSLSKIVRVLNTLNVLNVQSLAELSGALGVSLNHVKELVKLLRGLGLVISEGETLTLTQEGLKFLASYNSRNAEYIDTILSRIDHYRKVRECLDAGLSKPLDVAKCAGVNIVVTDITLRLIREVMALQVLNNTPKSDPISLEVFGKMLYEFYSDLVIKRKNKYVPIYDLMNFMLKKLNLNPETFTNLLTKLVREQRGRIMLISSPSLISRPFVEVDGKRYTYLMFLDR